MKSKSILAVGLIAVALCSCGNNSAVNNAATKNPTPATITRSATPVPTTSVPKNGDYKGTGVITKINLDLGSVELNHDEIKDLMPAMLMEFFVSDKKLLKDLKVGEKIDFVIRYKDGSETIVDITKAK